jgi:phthiocerol/phenolphthiocerol synthesis type-I polyketide synthase A
MTDTPSDVQLRQWLADYLLTTVGCDPDDIDFDVSFSELGIGSRGAVVLSGELADLVGRAVSPVEFWQHPTINSLVEYLTTPESEIQVAVTGSADRNSTDEPVAVIGLGCRFPGDIAGPEAFWQFLCEGRSAVGEVPSDRWTPFDNGSAEVADALSETTRWGSFLADIDAFDAEFFEISPREAAKMDPQQRLLLEVAYESLEHAGIRADSLRNTRTGVFVGACAGEYGYLSTADLSQVDAWSGTGGALSIIANRVSYFLDLRGPSVTVDTACSSALVAVHLACQSLRAGESDLAITAGVNLLLSPVITRSFDQAAAMSPTGQCHAFDASADGFVRGEGCGAVVLKRLSDALRDGDRVLAVVRGSAVNQDGRSNGLMAPNPAAQMAVLHSAYTNAGVEPRQVDYIEANATGTLLGDPIEARALGRVLGRGRPEDAPLLIGSVKPSLGHLDAAAGVAGLMKAVLAVQRGHIPANLNFGTPNPHIPFDDLRLKVVDQHMDWPALERPRRAGVSSFGFGGTNAHVVLEQGPGLPVVADVPGSAAAVTTLVVSGKTDERVASTAGMLAQWMDGAGAAVGLAEVAHTLNHHRTRHAKFATVAAVDRGQAVAGLRALAAGRSGDGVVAPHQGECRSGTVFVYSGQGSQWPGMGRQLLADEPVFAAAVAELEPVFVEQVGFSLREVLAGGQPVVGIDRIQPVLVAVQLALTELWRSYGVEPDAVIGHSMGEVSAAVVAGALTPQDGLRVIATRSRLTSRLPGQTELPTALATLAPRPPRIPVITTTGAAPAFDGDYWAASLDDPVRFSQAVATAGADYGIFVEVSPDPVLSDAITETLGDVHHHNIATLQRDTHDTLTFHTNLNRTRTTRPPDTDHPPEPHPVIPTTPWHHTRHWMSLPETPAHDASAWHAAPHWITIKERLEAAVSAPRPGTLLGQHVGIATTPPVHLWQAWLKPEAKPYPGLYRIRGVDVIPVSILLQTLSIAAAEYAASALSDVRFETPIVVDQPRVIQVVADDESVTVSSSFAPDAPANGWITHASARICHGPQEGADDTLVSGDDVPADDPVSVDSIASLQRSWGIEGQPFGWSVDSCQSGPGVLHADVRVPDSSTVELLDAAVHVARLVDSSDPRLMVPAAAESVRFCAELTGSHGAVEVHRRAGDGDEFVVDIVLLAPDGRRCLEIRSLGYTELESGAAAQRNWSELSAEERLSELEVELRSILARELRMSVSAVNVNQPFPELGLDSAMAMIILRETQKLVGIDFSATMLWDHPTVSLLAEGLAELLAPQQVTQEAADDLPIDSADSVLDELFDSVESASAGSESGVV